MRSPLLLPHLPAHSQQHSRHGACVDIPLGKAPRVSHLWETVGGNDMPTPLSTRATTAWEAQVSFLSGRRGAFSLLTLFLPPFQGAFGAVMFMTQVPLVRGRASVVDTILFHVKNHLPQSSLVQLTCYIHQTCIELFIYFLDLYSAFHSW